MNPGDSDTRSHVVQIPQSVLDNPDSLDSPDESNIHDNPLGLDSPLDSPSSLPPDPDPEPESPHDSGFHDNPLADDVEEAERTGRSTSMRKGMWRSMDRQDDDRDSETRSMNSEGSSTSWTSVHNNPLTIDDEYRAPYAKSTSLRKDMWKPLPTPPATSLPPAAARRKSSSSRRISFSLPWKGVRNLHYFGAGALLLVSLVVFLLTQINMEDDFHTCRLPT